MRHMPVRANDVRFLALILSCMSSIAWLSCSSGRREGVDVASLPPDVRPDYELFAQRCSKCHSLARPLESGITDDGFWKEYVERMRRQPSSGISPEDEVPILRFLHYYSLDKKRAGSEAPAEGHTEAPR